MVLIELKAGDSERRASERTERAEREAVSEEGREMG